MDITFSLPNYDHRQETAEDFLGPLVLVVRQLESGQVSREWLPAAVAVEDILYNPLNGSMITAAHIEWFDVLDEWGRSP